MTITDKNRIFMKLSKMLRTVSSSPKSRNFDKAHFTNVLEAAIQQLEDVFVHTVNRSDILWIETLDVRLIYINKLYQDFLNVTR